MFRAPCAGGRNQPSASYPSCNHPSRPSTSSPSCRPPWSRCARSFTICGGAGNRPRAGCSAIAGRGTLGTRPTTTRCACSSSRGRPGWKRSPATRAFLRELGRIHTQFKAYMARQDTYGRLRAKAAGSEGQGQRPHRLFLRRVRLPRVRAELLRRPGHPLGRPLQERQRPRPELLRRRPALPARLFQAADQPRRHPGGRPAQPEFLQPARAGNPRAAKTANR